MSDTVDKAISNVEKLFREAFHGGDASVPDEVLTKDFTFQYPFPGFSAGPEGIVEFSKVFHSGFPGFELEISDLFGSADGENAKVAIRWTLRGTHEGDFLGIPATSKYATMSAIGIYFGKNGLLSSGWLEMDTIGILQRLEAVAPIQKLLPRLRGK